MGNLSSCNVFSDCNRCSGCSGCSECSGCVDNCGGNNIVSSKISSVARSYIFPIPKCSYTDEWDNFVKIPHKDGFIPAFYFQCQSKDLTTIIYSHGNAEDIGHCYAWLDTLCYR